MASNDQAQFKHSRRRLLRWAKLGVVVGLGGCGARPEGSHQTEPTETSEPTPTPTETLTETHTDTPTETADLPEDSWPMFSHDRLNTGRNTATSGPRGSVEARWEFETNGAVQSSPAVVRGTVYIGSDDGHVYAIDAETGAEQWRFQTDGPVMSSPAYLRNVLYVGSNDHNLYALDAETGEPIWTFETGDRVRSAPTVAADIRSREVENVVGFGSDDGSVYYLDPKTAEPYRIISTNGPVVTSPVMYTTAGGVWEAGIGSTDGTSYWWIPEGGLSKVNTLPAGSPIHASMSSPEDHLESIWYRAHDDGSLHKRIFKGSNKAVWTVETAGKIRTTPTLVDGTVYVGSWDGSVYAVDTESGDKQWVYETGGKLNSSPAVAADTLYVGSDDQSIYALASETGDERWVFETDGAVRSSPAVVDGTVYVGSIDHSVYALAGQ